MKNKALLLALFIAVALVQAAAPLYMAWRWENILQTGRQFYWQTVPIDPYNAFKGRYVALRFKENTGPIIDNTDIASERMLYAVIAENDAGQAYISGITANRPAQGDYVKVKAYRKDKNTAYVILPFTRYYLPEDMAPAADAVYRGNAGKTGIAAVRIKDGYGVVEQLYIGEKTLLEFLRQPK